MPQWQDAQLAASCSCTALWQAAVFSADKHCVLQHITQACWLWLPHHGSLSLAGCPSEMGANSFLVWCIVRPGPLFVSHRWCGTGVVIVSSLMCGTRSSCRFGSACYTRAHLPQQEWHCHRARAILCFCHDTPAQVSLQAFAVVPDSRCDRWVL